MGQIWDVMKDITRALAFIHSEKEVVKLRNGKAKSFDLLGAMSLGQGNIQSSQPDVARLSRKVGLFLLIMIQIIFGLESAEHQCAICQVATFPNAFEELRQSTWWRLVRD